jgi:hypothetical protein
MSSPRLLLLTLAAVAAAAIAGCSIGDDGPRTTQNRDVPTFTRVDHQDSVDLRLHVGGRQRVEVRAGQKVIDDIRTEVHDGTLSVRFDHDGWGGGSVVVEATVPRLTAIEQSGSGELEAEGIRAPAFDLRSDGSGDIELYGTTERLTVDHSGSGDADLSGLTAAGADVSSSGSGSVDVNADTHLDVSLDGSGDVHYTGTPELVQHIDGSGDLSRAD